MKANIGLRPSGGAPETVAGETNGGGRAGRPRTAASAHSTTTWRIRRLSSEPIGAVTLSRIAQAIT